MTQVVVLVLILVVTLHRRPWVEFFEVAELVVLVETLSAPDDGVSPVHGLFHCIAREVVGLQLLRRTRLNRKTLTPILNSSDIRHQHVLKVDNSSALGVGLVHIVSQLLLFLVQ